MSAVQTPGGSSLEVDRLTNGLEIQVSADDGLNGVSIVFSPAQARTAAQLLLNAASEAELAARLALERAGPSGRGL